MRQRQGDMLYEEKFRLLKSMRLLNHLPDRSLTALAEFLKPRELADGAVVCEEGSWGMSLYFVSSGRIRIYKRAAGGSAKELAVVGPGDFFGEMALIEEVPRSAGAAAVGPCVLFELFRGDLARWVNTSPQQAVQFFAELTQVQSQRLRKTSSELTLHFDISNLLADSKNQAPEFLSRALERVVSHLDGTWSAAAYVYTDAAGKMEQAASQGSFHFDEVAAMIDPEAGGGSWLDDSTFHAALTGEGKTLGRLLFRAPAPVAPMDRDDLALTLTAVCRLITTALAIITFRAGEA